MSDPLAVHSPWAPAPGEYLIAGLVALVVGSWLIHEYFESSGRNKPFLMAMVPGA
ncbi:MAG: hypothetical protein ACRDX8_07495 [Acidimicrobiales bacterium]